MHVTSYIFFDGKCAEALAFYEKVLGARIEARLTYGESPAASHVPPAMHGNIIHARLRIGDAVVLASDGGEPGEVPHKAARFSLCVDAATHAEAERIFRDLSEGGEVRMKMDKTFFAERFGMATDRFGIPWMVIREKAGT